jgi:hypothetical protein
MVTLAVQPGKAVTTSQKQKSYLDDLLGIFCLGLTPILLALVDTINEREGICQN